jgi:hypothetical protein
MTKRRVGVSRGNGFEGSQVSKRDLGHPSVSPFDIAKAEALSFLSRLAPANRLLGMKNASVQQPPVYRTVALSFVIPSEAEGSAVPQTFRGNVFRQTEAEWRDLRFSL